MAGKKKFPYKVAVLACSGCARETESERCSYGCIGCGACEAACRLHAIAVGASGIAGICEELCVGCGLCVKACPQNVLHLRSCADYVTVKCSNRDEGKRARLVCDNSCIGCGICERTCTASAIHVQDHCATIDGELCLSCGMCIVKCPRGAIADVRGIVCAAAASKADRAHGGREAL